ncbi:MAG: hypothetical protein M1824_003866 [Vezdaea acicularis]|nr:MAG: hypothetical protein M1824_003866 [Vezdaea acicularis]
MPRILSVLAATCLIMTACGLPINFEPNEGASIFTIDIVPFPTIAPYHHFKTDTAHPTHSYSHTHYPTTSTSTELALPTLPKPNVPALANPYRTPHQELVAKLNVRSASEHDADEFPALPPHTVPDVHLPTRVPPPDFIADLVAPQTSVLAKRSQEVQIEREGKGGRLMEQLIVPHIPLIEDGTVGKEGLAKRMGNWLYPSRVEEQRVGVTSPEEKREGKAWLVRVWQGAAQ